MGKAIVTAARLGAVALCCVAAGCESVRDAVGLEKSPEGPAELRATWVVANTLRSESAAERTVREAEVSLQLNALFVQVRSRGDAWYAGGLEPRPAALAGTDFDPLDEAIDEGGDDVAVHAWVNACLVADAADLPRDPRHVVLAHPEWLSVPEPLARDLWNLPPRDPAYVERLARYVTERRTQVEGLFADPAAPEYRAHVVRVVEDLCRRYEIAGVHLDYIRYPGPEWGYSRAALDQFRVEVDRELSLADRRDMAARAAKDPLSYARRYARRFDEFRRRAVSQLVAEVASAARAARPGVWITAATFPELAAARDQKFQEWPVWLQRGDLDAACPMIYATRAELFTRQLRDAIAVRGRGQIWAGVGAWQLDASETARRVEEARAAGAAGVVLISHQGVKDARGGFEPLRSGPFRLRAPRPTKR